MGTLLVAVLGLAVGAMLVEGLAPASAFPPDFVWGVGTASYQTEGAVSQDGRVSTIWDTFSHTPGKTFDNETGDVADNAYNMWKTDVALVAAMKGVGAYRFSIAWARVQHLNGSVNAAGIAHYSQLIDALLGAGITPWVTLYHWDLPSQFVDPGWVNASYIVPLFTAYADLCFNAFGDRVQHWVTMNEPHSFCTSGYLDGSEAPGRCSDRSVCPAGNSVTEPYLCMHAVALAHASVVALYRGRYQPSQHGVVGMSTDGNWAEPLSGSVQDKAASERSMLFSLGMFTDPIILGDYPDVVKVSAGPLLPQFTEEERVLLKGSTDFIALNHYTSRYVGQPSYPQPAPGQGYNDDQWVNTSTTDAAGNPIGPPSGSSWLLVTPQFFPSILGWIHQRYPALPIYVTENGVDVPGESSLPLSQALNDTFRIQYLHGYISGMASALAAGVPVRGYFCWALLDNFEWEDGYRYRFGLHHVEYNNSLNRIPKASASWYSALASTGEIPGPGSVL